MIFRVLFDIQVIVGTLIPLIILILRRRSLTNWTVVGNVTGWLIIILLVFARSIWSYTSQHMWTTPIKPFPPLFSESDIWINVILGYSVLVLMGYQLYSFITYRRTYYKTLREEINEKRQQDFDQRARES